jgi:acyl carrier protein
MSGDIRSSLLKIFEEELSIDARSVRDDSHLTADLGFDSLAFSVGSVAIEESMGVHVPIRDLMNCSTFADLTILVDRTVRQ